MDSTKASRRLSADLARFGVHLLRQAAADSPTNLCVSPSSVAETLAMTLAGAQGQTAQQLAGALHLAKPDSLDAFADLAETAASQPELKRANRLWLQRGLKVLDAFLQRLATTFGAPAELLEFQSDPEPSRRAINAWVGERTNGRIPELIPEDAITELTSMVLTNAIHFLAKWLHEFDPDATRPRPFHLLDDEIEAESMATTEDYRYAARKEFRVLELPYRLSDEQIEALPRRSSILSDLAMLILLPDRVADAHELATSLTPEHLESPKNTALVHLQLPRLEINTSLSLSQVLQSLGITDAFDPESADFGAISDDPRGFYLSEVFHQTFVRVDEEGTEAAAATAAVMMATAAPGEEPPKPIPFHVDRPFLFAIRDTKTGLIHFLAYVGDPRW